MTGSGRKRRNGIGEGHVAPATVDSCSNGASAHDEEAGEIKENFGNGEVPHSDSIRVRSLKSPFLVGFSAFPEAAGDGTIAQRSLIL